MAKKKLFPPTPASHLERLDAMDLHVVSYLNQSITVTAGQGDQRNEWLPRDIIGTGGKDLIVWREPDKSYSIAGWEPWHDGLFGGRKQSIHAALNWIQRARDVRAGTAKDFLGV